MDNFDVTGVTGAKLRELVAEKVNVPANRLQLFCSGQPIEDGVILAEMNLPKTVKILASERVSLNSAVISSPLSSTAHVHIPDYITSTGTPTETTLPMSTSPPRTFSFASPLSTTRSGSLYGSDITLTEYLQRLLPLAHVTGTTYEEAAKKAPAQGITEGFAEQFERMASSSVPPQQFKHDLDAYVLPHPIEGINMTPALVARFDSEECTYSNLSQVRAQFDTLPELHSTSNKQFAAEVVSLLSKLHDVLTNTKNATLQMNAIAIQQRITNPAFISQYTTQKAHPIASNPLLDDLWERLNEARALMDSAKDAIDRTVYTDEVRVALERVIELSAQVEVLVNEILGKMELLRKEYVDFPAHTELRHEEQSKLATIQTSYKAMLVELRETSDALVRNSKAMKAAYDSKKTELGRKINVADNESLRLQKEQHLLLAAIDMLGRMYIEHEVERQKQLALSDRYTERALQLDEDLKRFTSEAARHAERVAAASIDCEAALKAIDLIKTSVDKQIDLLQEWTDDAKNQHTLQGVRALHEAHHTATVKFEALVEIWDSANRSLKEIEPEIRRLDSEILQASQARTQIRVETARRQKSEYERAIPIYEKTRDDANKEIEHLEQVLFPHINSRFAAYGQPPISIPARNVS